jgi:hypothetical protein
VLSGKSPHPRTRPAVRASATRRAALSLAALALILASAALSAGSRGASSRGAARRRGHSPTVTSPQPPVYGGEPDLARRTSAPRPARRAAVRFVRDYEQWSEGRLSGLPAGDATGRVIAILERRGRAGGVAASDVAASVRLARGGRRNYIVTSRVGNFIVAKRGSQWLVTSLPGD